MSNPAAFRPVGRKSVCAGLVRDDEKCGSRLARWGTQNAHSRRKHSSTPSPPPPKMLGARRAALALDLVSMSDHVLPLAPPAIAPGNTRAGRTIFFKPAPDRIEARLGARNMTLQAQRGSMHRRSLVASSRTSAPRSLTCGATPGLAGRRKCPFLRAFRIDGTWRAVSYIWHYTSSTKHKKGNAKWSRPDSGTGRILSGPTNKASRVCFSALAMVQILLALVTTL
jgi:hypothetical protein